MSILDSPPLPSSSSPTPPLHPSPATLSMPSWVKRLPDYLKMALYRLKMGQGTPLDLITADPAQLMKLCGMEPDAWQADLLRTTDQWILMLCSRQVGKTATAAAMTL